MIMRSMQIKLLSEKTPLLFLAMTDKFLEYLQAKKSRIARQIERLQRSFEEIERTEKIYRASGAASPSAQSSAPTHPVESDGSATHRLIMRFRPVPNSIQDRVCDILSNEPVGLTSHQILESLRSSGLHNLARSSLSPQLSRLKKNKKVELEGGLWKLVTK